MKASSGLIYGHQSNQHAHLDNGSDILAVAHLDTVQQCDHFQEVKLTGETLIYNAKLDDRLGVYTILDLLPKLGINVDVLLTENEETGQSTARDFKPEKQYNWIIEFDRMGTGAVLYQFNWDDTVKEYFKVHIGAFSDISDLGHLGCQAMNIGVGYHDCHSQRAYFVLEEYLEQIEAFARFHARYKSEFFGFTKADSVISYPDFTFLWCEDCAIECFEDEDDLMYDAEDNILCPSCGKKMEVY